MSSQAPYWAFYREVSARQLAAWLPHQPNLVLILSGTDSEALNQVRSTGHHVVYATDSGWTAPHHGTRPAAGVPTVIADTGQPTFLADASVDVIVAEQLSTVPAAEHAVGELARILRPGGRLLLRVDSLLLGMAQLAEQQRWAELSDATHAEVLLVPAPDGSINRCFCPEQLAEVLAGAGLETEWIRPRTVLSPAVVQRTLATEPRAFGDLVETELSLAADGSDDAVGVHLIASARRPGSRAQHPLEDTEVKFLGLPGRESVIRKP